MKIGSLYVIKDNWWFVFLEKEYAEFVTGNSHCLKLNNKSFTITDNDLVFLLGEDRWFKKFLTSDGRIGWAIVYDQFVDGYFIEVGEGDL